MIPLIPPIDSTIDGTSLKLGLPQPVMFIPTDRFYVPGLNGGASISYMYPNNFVPDIVEGRKCFRPIVTASQQAISFYNRVPVTSDTPVWQWSYSMWLYCGKSYFSPNAVVRVAAIYFATPDFFNKPDVFIGYSDANIPWWKERQQMDFYAGLTNTTNNFRMRVYYSSYHNNSAESGYTDYRKYISTTEMDEDAAWHLVTMTFNQSTTATMLVDDFAPSISENAVPEKCLSYKVFARGALCTNKPSSINTFMPLGPQRIYNFSLTQAQHMQLYNAGF